MHRLRYIAPLAYSTLLVHSKPPPYNERIRGVYENKIRQYAKPEKVFETFVGKPKVYKILPDSSVQCFFKDAVKYYFLKKKVF